MTEESIKEYTDDELVAMMPLRVPTKRDWAQAELTRRLMETIQKADESTQKYSKAIFFFTIGLFLVGMLQLAASVIKAPDSPWAGLTILILFCVFLYFWMRKAKSEIDKFY